MRINFADIGLMGQGMDASARSYTALQDAEVQRQRAEEDRKYQLEQRERSKEEQARQDALAKELREGLPKYLAGGAEAIPAKAATEAQPADDGRAYEDGSVPTGAQVAKPSEDNRKGLYNWLGGVYAKHGKMDQYEGATAKLKKLDEEGILDAIHLHQQGAPADAIMEKINATGALKMKSLRKITESEYAGISADGQPVSFDMDKMLDRVLTPQQVAARKDKSDAASAKLTAQRETLDARTAMAGAVLDAKGAALAAGEGTRAARAERDQAKSELDRAKAGTGTGTGPGGKPRSGGNWNQYDAQLKGLATGHLTSIDPDTMKPTVDRQNIIKLTSLAGALARKNPDLSPAEALDQAITAFDELKGIQEGASTQATDEAKSLGDAFKDEPKKKERWIKNRAAALARVRGADSPDSAGAPAPATAAPVEPQPTKRPAAYPSAELAPDGKWYVKKSDGYYLVQ